MTTVTILPEPRGTNGAAYRAITGKLQSVGRTAGEALDALTSQLSSEEAGTLVVIQSMRPDCFFTAEQRQRLEALMDRWRVARAQQTTLVPEEQAELDTLVAAELRAATEPLNITPYVAQQTVNAFVVMDISSLLRSETPHLVAGERLRWSVPVVLTSPARGVVGKVGELLVDATTGELLADEETVRRMTEDVHRLAQRSPL